MGPKHRLGDRREHPRFDVAGQLWASLEKSERVFLRNIGAGGAMVEAQLSPSLRTARTAHIALGERGPELNVVVRHIEPSTNAAGGERCLVGLEFINVSASARTQIDELVREWTNQPGG